MQMTNKEIVGKFNRADDKKKIVQILADLNGCSREDILDILRMHDIPESELPKKRGRKPVTVKKEFEPAELQEIGNPDQENAEKADAGAPEVPATPEMPAMPEVVSEFIKDEIERITKEIVALEKIRDELCDYRDGRGKWQR